MTYFLWHLKQRKLVQWVVAYVAAAFALLQGIDIFASRFAWSDSIKRILLIASCVGYSEMFALSNPPLRGRLMHHQSAAR